MYRETLPTPSWLRRRLVALISVLALAVIFVSVVVSVRTTSAPLALPSAAATAVEPVGVSAPSMGDAAATVPGTMAHLAQLDVQLYPPARILATTSEATRLAQLDADLYPPARILATTSEATRLAQLDAQLYPPASSGSSANEMARLARLDAMLYPQAPMNPEPVERSTDR